MSDEKILEKLEKIDRRLELIEKKLFHPESNVLSQKTKSTSSPKKKDVGTAGGIELLIDQGFFEKPKSMKAILDELKKEGYFYPVTSIDASVRKNFFAKKKILTRIKEGKVWLYVTRK